MFGLNTHWGLKMPDKVKTIVKGLSFGGVTEDSNAAMVDVKDGKIVRIRPLQFDWKYTREHMNPWKMEARGQVFELFFEPAGG